MTGFLTGLNVKQTCPETQFGTYDAEKTGAMQERFLLPREAVQSTLAFPFLFCV
jgi:hypothetical protein